LALKALDCRFDLGQPARRLGLEARELRFERGESLVPCVEIFPEARCI
jgi:hypothetical protein